MFIFITVSEDYLLVRNLSEKQEHGFKCGHGSVANLIRTKSDIMMSICQGKAVMLVLLDSCAVFDTANNDVLFFSNA